jgi:hypothetical protein
LNQSKSEVIRGHVQLLRWPQDCKSCETERFAGLQILRGRERERERWGFLYTFLMETIEEIWTLLCIFATWILSIEN